MKTGTAYVTASVFATETAFQKVRISIGPEARMAKAIRVNLATKMPEISMESETGKTAAVHGTTDRSGRTGLWEATACAARMALEGI